MNTFYLNEYGIHGMKAFSILMIVLLKSPHKNITLSYCKHMWGKFTYLAFSDEPLFIVTSVTSDKMGIPIQCHNFLDDWI